MPRGGLEATQDGWRIPRENRKLFLAHFLNLPAAHHSLISVYFHCQGFCCLCAKSLSPVQPCDPLDRRPTRLLHPWDSPGKNTGVSCHKGASVHGVPKSQAQLSK